jgi:hypothetical protein
MRAKRRFGYEVGRAAIVCAAVCMALPPAFAQTSPAQKQVNPEVQSNLLTDVVHALPPGGPAPRTADGHPDLSGVWFPNAAGMELDIVNHVDPDARRLFDPKATPEEKPSLQPSVLAKIKSLGDALRVQGGPTCEPEGVPGMFLMSPPRPWPIQLVQTTGKLVQLVEFGNNFRVIPTDGRPHEKNPDPTYNGDAVGHWEGDTLVIDVIGLDERSRAFLGTGSEFLHSNEEHVIERLSRPSMNYLVYQVTIEDPKALTKPWTSAPRRWSLSPKDEPLQEYYCAGSGSEAGSSPQPK